MLIRFNAIHQNVRETRVGMRPNVNDLVVPLVVRDETHVVVLHHFRYLFLRTVNQLDFFIGNDNVIQVE